jgi:hypothetical protein
MEQDMADYSFSDMPSIDPIGDPNYIPFDQSYSFPNMPDIPGIDPIVNTVDPSLLATFGSGGSGGSGGFDLTSIAKLLGLTGKDGNVNSGGLLALLSALGIGAGGLMNSNATKTATNQMSQSIDKANTAITGILGNAQNAYAPYQQAGVGALQKLQGMNYQPLAGKFGPVQAASSYVPTSAGRTLNQMYRG